MHAVAAGVVILAAVWLTIFSVWFRAVVIAAILFVIGLIIVTMVGERMDRDRQAKSAAERGEQERKLISLTDLEISEASVKLSFGDTWKLAGIILNKSGHMLTAVGFEITAQDCPASDRCMTVGQATPTARLSGIPAGQARAFEVSAEFKDLPKTREPKWSHRITETRGTPMPKKK